MIEEEHIEWIGRKCNRVVNGTCHTLSCLRRGGYKDGESWNKDNNVSTCIPYEIYLELKNEKANGTLDGKQPSNEG